MFYYFQPHGLQPVRFHCPWHLPGNIAAVVAFPSPGDRHKPGIKPASVASPDLAVRC